MRGLVTFIMVIGIALTTWGLVTDLGRFSTDLSRLVDYSGGPDMVLASTLETVQTDVLSWFGVASPDYTEQEVPILEVEASPEARWPTEAPGPTQVEQIPDTGLPGPTATARFPDAAGLVPYQVEVDGAPQQAPSLQAPPAPEQEPPETAQIDPTAQPEMTSTPDTPAIPGWIVIPSIGVDAPIFVSHTRMVYVDGKTFAQWEAPTLYAAGWQEGSTLLGQPGNTVLNGHHNIHGEVFGRLYELNQGDEIIVYSGDRMFHYAVSQVMKLEERNVPLEQRLENVRWVLPSTDERLTLVTCWPPTSNAYRLIVVAVPLN